MTPKASHQLPISYPSSNSENNNNEMEKYNEGFIDEEEIKIKNSKSEVKLDLGIENKFNPSSQNFEDVLEALGGFGLFQLFILVLLLALEVPTAFVTFIPIFVGGKANEWSCNNVTMSLKDVCNCDGERIPIYEDGAENGASIIGEWGLICEKEWVSDFITSIQMLGMFFGSIFGGQFADWYGRRWGFLGATTLLAVGSIISASAPNPYIYAVARFLCGAGVTSFMNVTLVGVVEVMPPSWRSLSNCVGPTGEGIMILSLMAYLIRPWRELYWATITPFALILVIYPFVPESPRWLMKQNRLTEAHKVFKLMAKMNRRPEVSLETLDKIVERERALEAANNTEGKRWSYLDFVRDPELRVTSIYNMAIWFAWSLTYYGISFNIKNVDGDIFLNVFFMGLANAIGQRVALLINNRLGRRKALFASMTFCAAFLTALAVVLVFVEHSKVPLLVLVSLCLLGQTGMASARSAARLLSGESFPTAVRTMGMGIGGITANIAGILTPQLAFLGSRWPSIPFFTFAFVSVGGSLISFLMSETMGKPLDSDGDVDDTITTGTRNSSLTTTSSIYSEEKLSNNNNYKSNISIGQGSLISEPKSHYTNVSLVSISKLAEEDNI